MNAHSANEPKTVRQKVWARAFLTALRRLPPHRAEQEANEAVRIYTSYMFGRTRLTEELVADYL
ncbi:hypothetical protein VI08_01880 [Luteibacter yeojuensis]|uniref:Uncharacterized protein n=1 Tax=Luteibacter yeojuensis TaxID=345309 RepID=A0A0F3L164_9GAMM|nr:hypothetical protein VI08_01880 [Luteibacter yeojuensis]